MSAILYKSDLPTLIISMSWTSGYGCVVDPHSRECTIAQPYPIPIPVAVTSRLLLSHAGVSRVRDLRELGRSVWLSLGTGVSMRLGAAKVEFNLCLASVGPSH